MSLAEELGLSCIKAYKMDATKAVLKEESINLSCHTHESNYHGHGDENTIVAGGLADQKKQIKNEMAFERNGMKDAETDHSHATFSGNHQEEGDGRQKTQSGADKVLQRQKRKAAAMIARGLTPPPAMPGCQQLPVPAGFPPCSFDHVLVDAPCSALGLRPRLLQAATLEYLRQCAVYQRRILDAAVQLLRPGGSMVFSTCTFNPGMTC